MYRNISSFFVHLFIPHLLQPQCEVLYCPDQEISFNSLPHRNKGGVGKHKVSVLQEALSKRIKEASKQGAL